MSTIHSASSSTATLIPAATKGRSAPKDYESALASLQSAYGLSAAPVITSTTTNPRTSKKATPIVVGLPARVGSEKDYAAAFGALQSTYGLAAAPIVTPASAAKPKRSKCSQTQVTSTHTARVDIDSERKQAAFATLVQKFGFGGGLPDQLSMNRGPAR
jgi:hypothetical protein